MARRRKRRVVRYVNPAWTGDAKPQPNINLGGRAPELRQTLGSGRLGEIFAKGARRYPVCPTCGLEVPPGDTNRKEIVIGDTAYEQALLMGGKQFKITYHGECEVPERATMLGRLLSSML